MYLRPFYLSLLLFATSNFVLPVIAQTSTHDITYATDTAGTQRGDLYQPVGAGPFPAIVYLHGGSWRSGDKSGFDRLGMDLARQGYAGFAINYDLRPQSFPLSWEEARTAVRFVRTHAAAYHIDPDRIVIAGTSAGGELAALVALAPDGPAMPEGLTNEGTAVNVSAAIVLNGVFDLCVHAGVIKRYLGNDSSTREAVCKDASPLSHIHANAPPFFVGHGTADHVVPFRAAQIFIAALQTAHVPVTTFVAQNGPHMYWTKKSFYPQNLAAVEKFLSSTIPITTPDSGHD